MTDHADGGVSPYLADIASQPEALARLLDAGLEASVTEVLRDLARFDRIILTGMGASLHALHPTFLRWAGRGLPVWALETSDLLGQAAGLLSGDSLLWVVSQSGGSAEVVALLDGLPPVRPLVVGVTSDTDGELAARADVVLQLHSGDEHTVGTKSYINTLGAHLLAEAVVRGDAGAGDLPDAPQALAAYLEHFEDHVEAIGAQVTAGARFIVGRGPSMAAVRTGALIVKEAAKVPCEGMSAPQFRHGPLDLVDDDVAVVVLEGALPDQELNRQTLADVGHLGGQAIWLSPDNDDVRSPALDGSAREIGEVLPLQALSVALARRRGIEPGAFRHIAKVTRTL